MERKSKIRAGVLAAIGAGAVALVIAGKPAVSTNPAPATMADRAPGYVRYVPDNLFAVSFRGANNGWAAGYYGTLLQTTDGGKSWVRRPLKSNDLIRRVRFLNDREGWAVGHRGNIFHTEDGGSNWTVQHQVPDVYLRDIAMVDSENGWAVGHKKTILRTTDGGRNWTPQTFAHTTQDPPRLNGVAAYDAMNAVAVGEFGVRISGTITNTILGTPRQVQGIETGAPFTTGTATVMGGAYATQITATGGHAFNTANLTGTISMVKPVLFNAFTRLSNGSYGGVANPGVHSIRSMSITFLPEPGATLLLGCGALGLIGIAALRRR